MSLDFDNSIMLMVIDMLWVWIVIIVLLILVLLINFNYNTISFLIGAILTLVLSLFYKNFLFELFTFIFFGILLSIFGKPSFKYLKKMWKKENK